MSTNESWNVVNWDEIPEDVKAVVTLGEFVEPSYYKFINERLRFQCYRTDPWVLSSYSTLSGVETVYKGWFHLRPKLPESTQVESSQVEDTSVPKFDWSGVDGDVEAVLLNRLGDLQFVFRTLCGVLHYAMPEWEEIHPSRFKIYQK